MFRPHADSTRLFLALAAAALMLSLPPATGSAAVPGINGKVAFKAGNDQIWVANSDGTGASRLTDGIPDQTVAAGEEEPAWSPFGDKLVYTSTSGGNQEVWTMDPEGSNKKKLTSSGGPVPVGTNGCGSADFACSEVLFSENPSWLPDGRQIIFTSQRELGGNEDLWIMNADGSNQHVLFASANPAIADSEAQFSPNGAVIVFHKDGPAVCGGEMWMMNADGTNAHQLLPNQGTGAVCFWDENYSWSPDGQKIAFTSDRTGRDEIWVVLRDGTGLKQLTNNLAGDGSEHPAWSPDGTRIMFGNDDQLWVMNADGSSPRQVVVAGLTDVGHPNWGRVSVRSFRAVGPMVARD